MRTAIRPTLLALALTAVAACSSTSGAADTDPQAGSNRPAETTAPATTEPEPEPSPSEEPAPGPLNFGESIEYDDGLQVTVGAPEPFTPSEYAAGAEGFTSAVVFPVTVVNGTGVNFDPSMFTTTLQSANVEGSEVFDTEQGLEGSPSTTLLPGREAQFRVGYGVTDPADLVLEVSPSWEHDNAIFATGGAGA